MTRYISTTDTAKLIRMALKATFPGVKFSVRSDKYAGGSSIHVAWVDGPTQREVEAITGPFAGADFDGMIDMKYHTDAFLMADGTACLAQSPGTASSRGAHEPFKAFKPAADAERVSFGADFVFCRRDYSEGMVRRALQSVHRRYGGFQLDAVTVRPATQWMGAGLGEEARSIYPIQNGRDDLAQIVQQALARRTNYVKAA